MKTTWGLPEAMLTAVLAFVVWSLVRLDGALQAPEVQEAEETTMHPISCYRPLNLWFGVSGLQVISFATAIIVGRCAENGDKWWFVDPCSRVGKIAFTSTWAVLLPLLAGWTTLGMNWLSATLRETPDCFADSTYLTPTMYVSSLVVCGLAVAAYALFVVCVWDAERCRRANTIAIESVQDADLMCRWGPLAPAATMELCGGLTPEEISALPRHIQSCDEDQCVVCLSDMAKGDHARALPGCGHVFHRACIDLWLLRKTTCPLCKTQARCDYNHEAAATLGAIC